MRWDVSIKGLRSRILVFRVWPWYSTWKIKARQSCMQKIGCRWRNKTRHVPFFSSNRYEPMAQWLAIGRLIAESLATWVQILKSAKTKPSAGPQPFFVALSPSVHCQLRFLCCCTLYNFFLGFRQWRSRADRVVNLNMTIRPPLFWRTCRASELTDRQVRLVSCFFYSWFLENTEKMKASAETFLRLMPSTGPQCMNSNSLTRVWKGPSVLVMQSSTTLGSQQAWARDWNTHDFKDACQLPHSSWDRNKSP